MVEKLAPGRIDRSNSPFTKEERMWIILEQGKLRNELQVRRAFRLQFNDKSIRIAILVPKGWGNCPLHYTGQGLAERKFNNRVISRFMDHPWPSRSPDLSPLDYWFLQLCKRFTLLNLLYCLNQGLNSNLNKRVLQLDVYVWRNWDLYCIVYTVQCDKV